MIVYKDYIVFTVLGEEICLISSETVYGRSTVAEVNEQYYYCGEEYPNIELAIVAWQEANNKLLSDEDLKKILEDNDLISAAI